MIFTKVIVNLVSNSGRFWSFTFAAYKRLDATPGRWFALILKKVKPPYRI